MQYTLSEEMIARIIDLRNRREGEFSGCAGEADYDAMFDSAIDLACDIAEEILKGMK